MVRRLAANEVKQVVLDAGKLIAPEMDYWAPVNLEYLGTAWESMCVSDMCRAYGLFRDGGPVGLLLGFISPDFNSGRLQGLEFFWGVQKKYRSKALGLLRLFESECKQAGCEVVIAGSIQSMEPGKMRRLYSYLGYKLHAEEFLKRL